MLSASEVIEKVIRDLKDAAELLKDDRIRTEGVMNGASEDPNENTDFRYRQFRMNYYAVQGLTGMLFSREEYKQAILRCTASDISEAAKTLQKHTVFFLKGVQ